jgi:hypothetical protein
MTIMMRELECSRLPFEEAKREDPKRQWHHHHHDKQPRLPEQVRGAFGDNLQSGIVKRWGKRKPGSTVLCEIVSYALFE